MTSDKKLPIDQAAEFVKALSARVYGDKQEVIDSFLDVQAKQPLPGMRAIAELWRRDDDGLGVTTANLHGIVPKARSSSRVNPSQG